MNESSKKAILFEGKTLEEAYSKASLEFNCSLVDLNSEVVQTPRDGLLGFLSRDAIVKVYPNTTTTDKIEKISKKIEIEDISSQINEEITQNENESLETINNSEKKEKIFDNFYNNDNTTKDDTDENIDLNNNEIIDEIKTNINKLFKTLCYDINEINVSFYDTNTIYIEFSGEDAALLIGKEGYRYKALSYIIFNWIHDKYNYMVRLEVAQFLVEQEKAVKKYLEPVIQTIKEEGFFKTKTFDGILVHIALSTLREEFPTKYVAVKINERGEKYILINEYKK